MLPDREFCLRAVASRDARFDGTFYTAVTSTGIYCRPSCPAMTPKPANTSFYASAAAAQEAGFRACRRCRPDVTPGSPEWDVRADVVARAMRLILDGVVDRDGVAGLSARLGYSARQVERLLVAEVGAGPLALARSLRTQTARVLLERTDLPVTEVAFAAGFGSVRTFNEAIRSAYAASPTQLRGRRAGAPMSRTAAWLRLDIRLPVRLPFEASNVFGHLIATAVPGVEEWAGGALRRTLSLPHGVGVVALSPGLDHVAATLRLSDPRDVQPAVRRCRRLLDLDADPLAAADVLVSDKALGPLVRQAPGRRVPGTVDAAELAVRAVLGQQVSTAAARTLAARLADRYGSPFADPGGTLTRCFPKPDAIAEAESEVLAMPASRARTVRALAVALAAGDLDLSPGCDRAAARRCLAAIPGIGGWTVELIAMRALGDPDAFPAADLGVRRGLAAVGRTAVDAADWRPWRAYAVQYLWATQDHPINRIPQESR